MKMLPKKPPPVRENGEHIKGNISFNDQHRDHVNSPNTYENMSEKQVNATKTSDQKRLNSLVEMKKLYRQKINTVKIALTNVDTNLNNKVVFEDDDGEVETKYDNINSEYSTNKKRLFEDNNDEEDVEYNFETKEQFEGQKGKKLMELQLKFKNDKRFKMDERFLEDNNSEAEEVENDNDGDTKPSIYPDNNVDDIEITLEEKQKELSILEEVLGKKIKKSKDKELTKKAINSVRMVRYDPTNPEHSKYVLQQTEPLKEKTKKRKHIDSVSENQEVPRPTVSKETFYEVKENFTETLKEDKPFSLLNLFNNHTPNDDVDSPFIEEKEILKTGEKNPFRYDSSDDENSSDEHKPHGKEENNENPILNADKKGSNNLQLGPTKLWREPFFFKEDDYRFQEGKDFVRRFALDDKMEFKQVRRNIKEIVRAKIRNNQRKNKPFRKKLGGKRMIKIKKAMKNR